MSNSLDNPTIHFPYVPKTYPQFILANRFDYTLSSIKYLLPEGLPDLKTLCITTAAYGQGEGNYDWMYPQDFDPLRSIGLNVEEYDIAGKSEQEVRDSLENVDIIIVTGGDTYYLLKHLRACNFKTILEEKIKEGVIYMASSAGAIVLGPDIDFIAPMDSPNKAGLTDFTGLDIIPLRIVCHLNHPHLAGAARSILERGEQDEESNMIGLLDEQFIVYRNGVFRVV